MSRKTKIVTIDGKRPTFNDAGETIGFTIDQSNRDLGKQYLITEMPVDRAEMWAFRALSAMAQGGLEIDDDTKNMGMAGVFSLGLGAVLKAPWHLLEPLLVEMFTCVKCHTKVIDRELIEGDIEEISTRMTLRMEVFKLHVDFSQGASPSASPEVMDQAIVAPITRTFPR
jgi:hypothetical protein